VKFFFFCPTRQQPSGGQKQLRLIASLLVELGAQIFLLRDHQFLCAPTVLDDYLFPGVPVVPAPFAFEDAGNYLNPNDVVILNEGVDRIDPIWRNWRCRIGLLNQNGFFALRYCPTQEECGNSFEFAIAVAPYVASICQDFIGISSGRIFQVPVWIVRPPFHMTELSVARTPSICFMPRKLPDIVKRVRELVLQTHPTVPWVEIDGLPEVEVARVLRNNSIFFAAHDLEACPTSGLEAMVCGCLVAGFRGTGQFPHPYATSKNGIWVPDRNVPAAANAVRFAIDVVQAGGPRYFRYLQAGRQTVGRFTKEELLKSLRPLLEVVTNRGYERRRDPIRGMGLRGTIYAYWLLYNYDRLGRFGRFLSWISKLTKPVRRRCSLLISKLGFRSFRSVKHVS
jgi:hypothetical protein